MFEAKIPARKFKGYVCANTEAVAAAVIHEKDASMIHVENLPNR